MLKFNVKWQFVHENANKNDNGFGVSKRNWWRSSRGFFVGTFREKNAKVRLFTKEEYRSISIASQLFLVRLSRPTLSTYGSYFKKNARSYMPSVRVFHTSPAFPTPDLIPQDSSVFTLLLLATRYTRCLINRRFYKRKRFNGLETCREPDNLRSSPLIEFQRFLCFCS